MLAVRSVRVVVHFRSPPNHGRPPRSPCAQEYTEGGGLLDVGHTDQGSWLSMSILLAEPAKGGEFVTYDAANRPQVHSLTRGDAVLFRSNVVHHVATVEQGVRRSLVLELWDGPINTINRHR